MTAAAAARWRVPAIHAVDVLAYVLVLGTFTQLFPSVIAESFLLVVLTALLLKLVLEAVLWAKKRAVARVTGEKGRGRRAIGVVTLLVLLPGSKFLVLELTALVFAGAVRLGGFLEVTALIVVLMLARAGLRRLVAP